MYQTIAPQAMQALEKEIMARTGLPGLLLMEHAALGAAAQLDISQETLFLCGPGNNGGDGFAMARLFALKGGKGQVWKLPGELRGDALTNYELLRSLCPQVEVTELTEAPSVLPQGVTQVVDALFGTGLARPLEGIALQLARLVNAGSFRVLAVDIPSGLCGTTGKALGEVIRADITVTFHRPKDGLYLADGPDYTGPVIVHPIGLPEEDTGSGYAVLEDSDVPALLGRRPRTSHKGHYGRVLIRAGSPNMAGAAALCAQAALKAGAGLVTVCCDETTALTVHALAPCAMTIKEEDFAEAAAQADVIAAGPGLGRFWESGKGLLGLVRPANPLELMARSAVPCIWDADALNYLASAGRHLLPLPANHVFTPHPGEAARLLQVSVKDVEADRPAALQALQALLGGTVILKGVPTLIAAPEGQALNCSGCPAMAKGGSGDALTGLLAALSARQGLTALQTAQLACHLHGRAGEKAAAALGENAVTALDLITCL